MRYIFTCLLLVASYFICGAQDETAKRIVLIGNAGESIKSRNGLLELVRDNVVMDSNTVIIYLGNNVFNSNDTSSLRKEAEIVSNTDAKAFFIPGYKDWAKGTEKGYNSLITQQHFLEDLGNKNIKYYPGKGCGGPKEVDLGNDAVMVIMDSQWWLHEHSKPDIESDCKFRTKEEILSEIEDMSKDKLDKLVLLVTYHPLENTGVHSGTYGWKQHIFPLTDIRPLNWLYLPMPVIGSAYPITRNAIAGKQDMNSEAYQSLASKGMGTLPGIKKAFKNHPNIIYIAGQEENLQLLEKNNQYYINSGAGGKAGRTRNNKEAIYVKEQTGFTVLEISKEKKVKVRFYVVHDNRVKEDHVADLMDYSKLPPLARDTATLGMIYSDSITARADLRLAKAGFLKRVLIGENYRKEWSAPVRMQVLHIDKEKGGMKIKGIGGGHESTSLQLEDADGKKWVFRSVNKNLEAVIPEGFQETVASDYIHDMLSASNPYGALAVPGLEKPLNIVHATPQMYFVPNDTALGVYRPLFANTVGLLEERKPALNDNKIVSSNVAINNMIKNSDHFSDQMTYLKIRLVDFLIADFDRHHGQYSWGTIDSSGRDYYYPIPKDRDQAFYHNKGLIMAIMKHGGYKFMVNFPYKVDKIKNSGIVGAYLDMLLTNKLRKEDWATAITEFEDSLTDNVIDTAVKRMPPEIYAIHGPVISAKLKSRRNSIVNQGMNYYSFISKKVNVLGGNHDEVFKVTDNDSGLKVQVFAKDSDGVNNLRYSRTFDDKVTKEIRLYGFNGNDYFDIDDNVKSKIKLKIVGGKGDDTFNIRGRVRNKLYDLSQEDNMVLSRSRTTRMFSSRPSVNEFQLREPIHNSFSLPIITFAFNQDDGLMVGGGISYKTYGFRKYPYASLQRLATSFAFSSKAYQIRYNGEFIDFFRHYDLLVNANHFDPVLSNFFGYGNESFRDKDKSIEYFRTRYNYISDDIQIRKRFLNNRIMSLSIGPSSYYYWNNQNQNIAKVLERPDLVGLDSSRVYSRKFYAGGKANFAINTLNSEFVPTRGINWNTEFTALQSLNENTRSYSRLISTLDIYSVLDEPNRVLAALHFGGGHIFSDNFEYFQALTLGGNNYLRGYRVNRFAGSSMAYASAELKVKLFSFNAYLVKGDFGLVGFNDIGRVWMPNEQSKKWHHGYGGGFYVIPFNTLMLSVITGFSEEDRLFNLSLGTKLNMVFQGQ